MTANELTAPAGTYGLAVEPWAPGEIYAVAADWAQASCPVLQYGPGGWGPEPHGRQVADFRHSPRSALESLLREAIQDDDAEEIEGILDDATEIDGRVERGNS